MTRGGSLDEIRLVEETIWLMTLDAYRFLLSRRLNQGERIMGRKYHMLTNLFHGFQLLRLSAQLGRGSLQFILSEEIQLGSCIKPLNNILFRLESAS